MASCQHTEGSFRGFLESKQPRFLQVGWVDDPLEAKLVGSQRARFVEGTQGDRAHKGNSVWLSAEDAFSLKVHDRGIHGDGDDHGQFRRDHGGDDLDASEEKLVLASGFVLEALVEDVSRTDTGEDEEDEDECKCIGLFHTDIFIVVDDSSDEFSFSSIKACPEDHSDTGIRLFR